MGKKDGKNVTISLNPREYKLYQNIQKHRPRKISKLFVHFLEKANEEIEEEKVRELIKSIVFAAVHKHKSNLDFNPKFEEEPFKRPGDGAIVNRTPNIYFFATLNSQCRDIENADWLSWDQPHAKYPQKSEILNPAKGILGQCCYDYNKFYDLDISIKDISTLLFHYWKYLEEERAKFIDFLHNSNIFLLEKVFGNMDKKKSKILNAHYMM